MTLNHVENFARLLEQYAQREAALQNTANGRRASAGSRWREQSDALAAAAQQLEQEYRSTETRIKSWASHYDEQAKQWIQTLTDPRWQKVKEDCFLQCTSNRVRYASMNEAELVACLQERQAEMAATLHRLQNSFIPPAMSGVVGGVFPGYKRKHYRQLAQQYTDILTAAAQLNACGEQTDLRRFAASMQARKQQEFDRQRDEANAASDHQLQTDRAALHGAFLQSMQELETGGFFAQSDPLAPGWLLRQNPLPGVPLPACMTRDNAEGQILFPVTLPRPRRACFFLTDDSTHLGPVFSSVAADLLCADPDTRLYFADLGGLGSNYSAMIGPIHWGCAEVWSNEEQLRQGLAQLNRRISQFHTTGAAPTAPCFLFVEHLERNIPPQDMETLFRIIRNGAAAGVVVLFSMEETLTPERPLAEQLRRLEHVEIFSLKNNCLPLPGGAALCLSPRQDLTARLEQLGAAITAHRTRAAILPLGPRLPAEGAWQRNSAAHGVELPIGDGPDGQPVLLRINEDKPYVLTIGDVDVGKSSLHHTICLQLMSRYGPDEVHLAIGDFKLGAEFNAYATANLPSVETVVNDQDPDVMASFLRHYVAEMQRRQQRLADMEERSGQLVRKYETFRDLWEAHGRPGGPMPRIIILIDEFQSLFENGTVTASLLSELVRKGRTYGIHLVMASQRAVADDPNNGFTAGLRTYFTSRFVLRCPQAAARTVLLERCADTGRENTGITTAPRLPKGHAVFNDYMGETESGNRRVQCYYPDDHTISTVCQILSRLNGPGSSVLLKRGASSPAPVQPREGILLLGASACLHQDGAAPNADTVLDDTAVGLRMDGHGQNLLLSGGDLQMVRSVTQSAALYLRSRHPGSKLHVFGLPAAPLVRELQAANDDACVFHTTEEQWREELTRQTEQPDEARVNLFVNLSALPCFVQGLSSYRTAPEVELLKQVLDSAAGGETVNLLYGKSFRELRNQAAYAVQAAPIRLTAVGDSDNLRAAMPDTCRLATTEFDLPRTNAIRAYYCNADSGKWGKVLLFRL